VSRALRDPKSANGHASALAAIKVGDPGIQRAVQSTAAGGNFDLPILPSGSGHSSEDPYVEFFGAAGRRLESVGGRYPTPLAVVDRTRTATP